MVINYLVFLLPMIVNYVTPMAVLVAVMAPDTERSSSGRHYAAAVTGSAERVARLAALGRQGFEPVAATPIDDSRVPEQRHWMVVAEQTTTQPQGRARKPAQRPLQACGRPRSLLLAKAAMSST